MGFFETLGVIAFLVIFVWLLNAFLDEYNRVNSEADEKRRQLEEFSRQEEIRKEEYSEWAKDNPEEAARREKEEQKRIEENRVFTQEVDNLYDLMQEINYLEQSGRKENFEYLSSFKKNGPSKYWNNEGVLFPEEADRSNELSFVEPPWKDSYEEPGKFHMLTVDKLSKIYQIPLWEMASLYRFQQSKITPENLSGEMNDLSNWHQFILGQIESELRILRSIGIKRNTTPIYSQR